MAWMKGKVGVDGKSLDAEIKTIGGVPVRLETTQAIVAGATVEIDGAAFRAGKARQVDERHVTPLQQAARSPGSRSGATRSKQAKKTDVKKS